MVDRVRCLFFFVHGGHRLMYHCRMVSRTPCRIITYVLLCGYSPFRSDDTVELIRETTEAQVEFHERYWGNVSPEGEQFHLCHVHLKVLMIHNSEGLHQDASEC